MAFKMRGIWSDQTRGNSFAKLKNSINICQILDKSVNGTIFLYIKLYFLETLHNLANFKRFCRIRGTYELDRFIGFNCKNKGICKFYWQSQQNKYFYRFRILLEKLMIDFKNYSWFVFKIKKKKLLLRNYL